MTFDRFIEILNNIPEFEDWFVDATRFKGNDIVNAEVVFRFEPTEKENEN